MSLKITTIEKDGEGSIEQLYDRLYDGAKTARTAA